MKEIIKVERKRILNLKSFLIISGVILIFSIFSSAQSLKNYNVYDSSGNIIMSSKENLKESKLKKHNRVLDEKTIKDVVERKDKSKYLYNSNLVTLIASNYNKKIEELTSTDISNFYDERILNLENNLSKGTKSEDVDKLSAKGEELKAPIKIGYAEGWKNLNNDMVDFTTMIIFFIPFVILPLFAQDPKTRMKELYTSTKHGKHRLVKAKVISGFQVGALIYCTVIFIFSLSKLMVFGFKGADLPIQGSVNYLLCPYNITYFQQYLINVLVGFMAMLVLVAATLLVTAILEQILTSAVVVIFILAIMTMLPNNSFNLNHYFKNFLPYSMTNFNSYYIKPEIYNIGGIIVPTFVMVGIISLLIVIIYISATMIISNTKLAMRIK